MAVQRWVPVRQVCSSCLPLAWQWEQQPLSAEAELQDKQILLQGQNPPPPELQQHSLLLLNHAARSATSGQQSPPTDLQQGMLC